MAWITAVPALHPPPLPDETYWARAGSPSRPPAPCRPLSPAVCAPRASWWAHPGVAQRQFSVTGFAAVRRLGLVALILPPVRCASLLKPVPKGHEAAEAGFSLFRPFFRWFDRGFHRARDRYQDLVDRMLARKLRYFLIYLLIVAALGFLFHRMPTAYLPNEDQGIVYAQVTLPAGSTLEQTDRVMDQVEAERPSSKLANHGIVPHCIRWRQIDEGN